MAIVDEIRAACAEVARRARSVRIAEAAIPAYAERLSAADLTPPDPSAFLLDGPAERRAAFALQLDAINFGSGWFPTLRKRDGRSGYYTVAMGFREHGPFSTAELSGLDAAALARICGQDPEHELMALYARSLRDLGERVGDAGFLDVVERADGSAVALAERLAGWDCFADVSPYEELRVPFLKRAQIAAADLAAAGVARWRDEHRLTLFADNLVPHVLRVDGLLELDPGLRERIDGGSLLDHDAPEEVELRACALHAVELLAAAHGGLSAARIDQLLWHRGQGPHYKAIPRPRARCTAY